MHFPKSRLAVVLSVLALVVGCARRDAADKPPATRAVEIAQLAGKWQRPDGGYVLEIHAATGDGKLDASYFNPNPIHVAQATWTRGADEGLDVFVELRDVNYPGATYKLHYRADSDAMTGLYNQPKLGQTFEVEFHRML